MFCIDPYCKGTGLQNDFQYVTLRMFAHMSARLDEHAGEMCMGEAYKRLKMDMLHKSRKGSRRAVFALMLGSGQTMWADSITPDSEPSLP